MTWLKVFDEVLEGLPTSLPGQYNPIPPVVIGGVGGNQLVVQATIDPPDSRLKVACNLTQIISFPGEEFSSCQGTFRRILVNQSMLISLVPASEFTLQFDVPWWINRLTLRVWSGESADLYSRLGNLSAEADQDCPQGSPLYIKESGHVGLAQASSLSTAEVAGLALRFSTTGSSVIYVSEGFIEVPDWSSVTGRESLITSQHYYLSPDEPGKLTVNVPDIPGQVVTRIGRAISPSKLDLEIQQPILL